MMAAVSYVFTIDYVTNMLGEDVEWLSELQIDMEPEDGSLWVPGVGQDNIPALTPNLFDKVPLEWSWTPLRRWANEASWQKTVSLRRTLLHPRRR
jgi:hypothetical protein